MSRSLRVWQASGVGPGRGWEEGLSWRLPRVAGSVLGLVWVWRADRHRGGSRGLGAWGTQPWGPLEPGVSWGTKGPTEEAGTRKDGEV